MIIDGLHEKNIFSENFPFRLAVNTEEDFDYPSHWHNAIEILFALKNYYSAVVNNMEYHMDEKDILIIAGGDIHGFYNQNNKGERIFIQFDISSLKGFGNMDIIKPIFSQTRKIPFKENTELCINIERQIHSIIEEHNRKDFAYELFLNARIYDILVLLSRSLINKLGTQISRSSSKKINGLEKINKAFKYIEDNFQNDITLGDVAKSAGFSEYHFSRIFKEIIGKNFHCYLNEYRIKKAEKLFINNDITVAQAAYSSGFNSIVTFNRLFKEIKGCTPTYYKKMQL